MQHFSFTVQTVTLICAYFEPCLKCKIDLEPRGNCFFGFCCRMMRAGVSMDEASRWGLKDKKHPLENLAGVLFTFEIFTCSILTSHNFPFTM